MPKVGVQLDFLADLADFGVELSVAAEAENKSITLLLCNNYAINLLKNSNIYLPI